MEQKHPTSPLDYHLTTKLKSALGGYHLKEIPKGELGSFSKLTEEMTELEDALLQKDKILAIIELSDLYGAIQFFVEKEFGMTMDDLKRFSDKTIKVKIRENNKFISPGISFNG